MSRHRIALFALLASTIAVGCTDDPVFPVQAIQVTAADMPAIAGDGVYELWLSYPEERANPKEDHLDHGEPAYFSVGRFVVDASGAISAVDGGPPQFAIPPGYNPALVGEALVTIESRSDNDSVPDARLLSGSFTGSTSQGYALLQTGSPRTFDTAALRGRKGSFVLESATAEAGTVEPTGIWFLLHRPNTSTGDSLTAGIGMPTMPLNHDNDRWVYETWLVETTATGRDYRSLGRFRDPAGADANGAGPGAGPRPERAYPYPGEDFIAPTPRTLDSTVGVIVSMQPEDIALSAPLIRLLERASIPGEAPVRSEITLTPTPKLPIVEVTIAR